MKSASRFLSAALLLVAFARGEAAFLVIERLGVAQVRLGTGSNEGTSGVPWRDVENSMKIPPGSLLRTGDASVLRFWLRPMARLSLGEKSKLILSTEFAGNRQVHLAVVDEGRACLEAPRLEENLLHEIRLGEVRVQCGRGKVLVSRSAAENTVSIWQWEGESHVTADAAEDGASDDRGSRLGPVRGVSLAARERLMVRNLRYSKRTFEGVPEEFGFAFVKPAAKPRGSEGYLDKRERWE
ncbi:MAG: hypothetical protein J0L75_14985 [Spirochaetes bacterium]|nr:hypothetical protein [Spirochaetota bacterium]